MQTVDSKQISKLNKYFKTFSINYSEVSRALGLDNSMIGKYFNNKANMSVNRYMEILHVLKEMASEDELRLYLINNWLKIETPEQKVNSLKSLSNKLETLSLELKDIIGE